MKKEKKPPWEYSEEFLTWFQDYPKNKTTPRDQLWEVYRAGYSMGYRQGRGVA